MVVHRVHFLRIKKHVVYQNSTNFAIFKHCHINMWHRFWLSYISQCIERWCEKSEYQFGQCENALFFYLFKGEYPLRVKLYPQKITWISNWLKISIDRIDTVDYLSPLWHTIHSSNLVKYLKDISIYGDYLLLNLFYYFFKFKANAYGTRLTTSTILWETRILFQFLRLHI